MWLETELGTLSLGVVAEHAALLLVLLVHLLLAIVDAGQDG